ncbi:MAG: radical SAM-associated putative lipoprotein [Candidatus Azobacteroides sp.]|nr:radical SAM-associated putative lipoprotein [Candidatus Azobacteroides sp.]
MKINRAFIKGTNWALAGLISLLGFTGCKDNLEEYGSPSADYTVKGAVVNKTTGKPVGGIGIHIGYPGQTTMYGTPSTTYESKTYVTTDAKGEFKITTSFFYTPNQTLSIYADDIDGEENGLFQSEVIQADFSNAEQSKKPNGWYQGEYTVTLGKVELTEIKEE